MIVAENENTYAKNNSARFRKNTHLYQAASLLVALLLLSWAAIPGSIKSSARTSVIKTFFRPEHKLLTEEEFITQGVVETKKALDQLKEYCRSPESKPWQTVRKLQSPVR